MKGRRGGERKGRSRGSHGSGSERETVPVMKEKTK